jgi:hypothetical protein
VDRATAQKVDAGPLQLPCRRSGQDETETAVFDVAVDFVEETGQPLNLVHEHPAAGFDRSKLGGESSRVCQIALIQGLVEQVDAMGIRKLVTDPGRLAGSPRAEQKER